MKYTNHIFVTLSIFFLFILSFFSSTYWEIDPGIQRIDSGFDHSHCSEQEDVFFEFQCIHGLSAFGPEWYAACAEKSCTVEESMLFKIIFSVLCFIFISGLFGLIFVKNKTIKILLGFISIFWIILFLYWLEDAGVQNYTTMKLIKASGVIIFLSLSYIIYIFFNLFRNLFKK